LKAAVEALCRKDASLITEDAILSFAMTQLQKQNTDFSRKLFDALGKTDLRTTNYFVRCFEIFAPGEFFEIYRFFTGFFFIKSTVLPFTGF